MSPLSRIIGFILFLLLVLLLWYLSPFWPWREICGQEGPLGIGWLATAVEPICAREGIAGFEWLDRRGGIVQRRLQANGLGEFGIVTWGLLAFLILSLTQVVWGWIAGLGGDKE